MATNYTRSSLEPTPRPALKDIKVELASYLKEQVYKGLTNHRRYFGCCDDCIHSSLRNILCQYDHFYETNILEDMTTLLLEANSINSLGVLGKLGNILLRVDLGDEACSLYLESLHKLAFVEIETVYSTEEIDQIVLRSKELKADQLYTEEALLVTLGIPSLILGRRVYCYAPIEKGSNWFFVDFFDLENSNIRPPKLQLATIRLPKNDLRERLLCFNSEPGNN
ncbi:MAG: hypothetical protein P1V97_30375 [Planctomycetota bacterium]|nr:hypothetical protein [Planctomycetota bacterium]